MNAMSSKNKRRTFLFFMYDLIEKITQELNHREELKRQNIELEKNNKELEQKLEEQKNKFYPLAQNHASNKLQKTLTKQINNKTQIDLLGNGSIVGDDFKLFIKGYSELINGVKQSAAMLLDCLMIKATETGLQDTLVELPLKDYMTMRKLKDKKEARKQIKEDLTALERISFEYKGTGKNKGIWLKVHISGGTTGQIKNGDIVFRFNQDFYDSFKAGERNKHLYMYFPREALQYNSKYNPWTYWLARKISEHKRMNLGKPNEDTISVKTLINACPDFPTYESLGKAKQVNKRIIESFERDLDALNETLTWEYKDLAETQNNYTDFINANIIINWKDYPDLPKLKENKRKQATIQENKKKQSIKGTAKEKQAIQTTNNMTAKEKREIIQKHLTKTPEKSNRQIAREVRVDHKTVNTQRKKLTEKVPQ